MEFPTYYVVIDSAANMPNSCWGRYRRIGLLEVKTGKKARIIDDRPRYVKRIVQTWERLHDGKTIKCAFNRALDVAEQKCDRLNIERTKNVFGDGI